MIKPPIIQANLQVVTGQTKVLKDKQTAENIAITKCDFSGSTAAGISVDDCTISNTDVSNSKLKKLGLIDTRFDHCQLHGVHADGSGIQRVEVSHTSMSGIVLSDSLIKDVRFTSCKINVANFRFAKLVDVAFVDCDLREADFQNSILKNVNFEGCDLEETDFSQAKLTKVDLRGATLAGIKGLSTMKGAIISSSQLMGIAPELATQVGIVIDDD